VNRNEKALEENAARLIRAAYGPDARPGSQASETAYRLLLAHVRAKRAAPDFPDLALGILGAVFVCTAAWLAARVLLDGTSLLADPSLVVVSTWVILNLAMLPIASIIILQEAK
jgi:hypothetical protein